MVNQSMSATLSIWHSKAFQYIVFTICAIVLAWVLQRFIGKFVDCTKCAVPQTGKKIAQYAARRMERSLNE